ncbi:MAG: hypothetical protein JW836_06385 [Deltaproteobacteria bacterium]|nr:hypothetical protein [Deltaproteobacteria bacterium]
MHLEVLRSIFMWCTIINGALLILSFLICAYAGDFVYRMHGMWFAVPRETFNVVLYSFIGFFKMVFLVFNLVPYLALLIVG